MFAHITETLTNTQVGPCKTVSGDTYVMGGPGASSIETGPQPWVPKMVLDLRGKKCDTDSLLQKFAPHFQDQKTSPPSGPCFDILGVPGDIKS
jgi:hypothetical protein